MNVKKVNEFFGYALFTLGTLKILLVVLILARLVTNLNDIFSGGSASYEYFPTLVTILNIAETILVLGSIVMIIFNMKKQKEVIIGYLLVLGAVLIGFITPSIMSIGVIFIQSAMYMKASSKIRNKNSLYKERSNPSKKMIKNTEWFYSESNKTGNIQIKNNMQQGNQKQNEAEKLEENSKSKNSLDSDYFNDAGYNNEKEGLTIILIISFIILILLLLGIFIYILIREDNKNDNIDVAEASTSEVAINLGENKTEGLSLDGTVSTETDVNTDTRLTQMADIFNNSKFAQNMISQGYTINATPSGTGVNVSSSGDGLYFNVQFILNNNILSADISNNEVDARMVAIKLFLAVEFVDSAGQLRGFPEGALFNALGKEEYVNYTLENEGAEIKLIDDENKIVVRVNLNSDFSFLNN